MIAIKFWFNNGQGHGQPAGIASRLFRHRKVKFKMFRERNQLLLLARFRIDISKLPVD
jgi:hypothetical protein